MASAKKPTPYKSGYGKRPTWQWILLYVIIGGLIYLFIYWLFFRDSNGGGGIY